MKPSRRDVCRLGIVGAASLGLASACDASRPLGSSVGGEPLPGEKDSQAFNLSLHHFTPLLGTSFRFVGMEAAGATHTASSLTLSAVDDLGIAGRAPVSRAECFSLSFSSREGDRADEALAQGTYAVSHDSLGSFPLFVVPGLNGRPTYTALVNRL